jgi:AcrR family transcriptional regulator
MLNMSSVPDADLTAKARIRSAAISAFVRDGFQKANVRAIAAAAGVSVGLVFHHFGSKDGLRTVCDEHVLEVMTSRARSAGTPDLLGEYLSDPDEYRLLVQYMARAIHDDAPAAGTFVERVVAESEAIFRAGAADGTMHPSSDPRALGVLSVLISLAVLTMPRPLARALGHEDFGPEVLRRMTVPTLELFTRGLYTDDTLLKTAEAAWTDAERTEP